MPSARSGPPEGHRAPLRGERAEGAPAACTPTMRPRDERLDGAGDAGDQPAAADRHHQGVHLRQLLEDLQPHRPLAGDHQRVVEGGDEEQPRAACSSRAWAAASSKLAP